MIPITKLCVGEEEALAAADVVRSGWLTQGKRCEQFEEALAQYVGAQCAITTNSCTTALHLALVAAGVKPGDEVICPSFSFIATANSIVYAGATPVFVDIDPRTFNINPALIESAITSRTTAILPVSQIGLPADIPAIMTIARRHGLAVIEDAAPSLGAALGAERLGGLSDFTCFSLDARKIITTGEGGVITTNDEMAAARLRALRAHAASVTTAARHTTTSVVLEDYPELGYNYKLTDIQAAIAQVQLGRIEHFIAERRRLAYRYNELLAGEGRIEVPFEPANTTHVYQSYCIRLHHSLSRLTVMQGLAARGIASRRITAIHRETFYRDLTSSLVLPETDRAGRETLLLPLYVGLTDAEQDEVVDGLRASLDQAIPLAS
jgi:perosamine synthetase